VKGWLYFAFVQLVAFIAMVLGWVLLLPWSLDKAWVLTTSFKYNDQPRTITEWSSALMDDIYGNAEDGVTGADWYLPGKPVWLRAYMWSAWRNSCNNLRFVFRWYGKDGAPFFKWVSASGKWYFQAGWFADNGFPVLSAGRV
jgi:hypothetical protein